MFFVKFFYFLKGYVIIRVEGSSLERFISICIHRNIRLLELDKRVDNYIQCVVSRNDFKKLRPIVYKTKMKVRIVRKLGLPAFWKVVKRRMGFFVGILIFPLVIFIMSQFIWSIQINGVSINKTEEIKRCLNDMGIKEGMTVHSVPKASDVKFYLLDKFDYLSWAWVYVEGTRIRVEVREGIPIPEIQDDSRPCDIVAVRSGVVEEIITKKGRGIAKKGNVVSAGDVLVAGTVEFKDGAGFFTVHADGEVRAKTSHTASGTFPLYYEYQNDTGDVLKRYTIKAFKWDIPLYKNKPIPFETYTVSGGEWEASIGKGYYLGFGLKRDVYSEIIVHKEVIPYETAVEIARYRLENKIASELTVGAELKESNIYTEQLDDETLYVSLTMNFTENIGIEKEFE